MRRNRRNGHSGLEFGGSGEDSFVAVVVTKLTGALLFILLLTMVIMALLPKAVDMPSPGEVGPRRVPTRWRSPPPTIASRGDRRPALRAGPGGHGGRGPLQWSVSGELPDGLSFDPENGLLRGTPRAGTPKPVELVLRVSDGASAGDAGHEPGRLPVGQAADHARLVEAGNPAGPLAGLAGTGVRVPRPLAGPSGGDEHRGESSALVARRARSRERRDDDRRAAIRRFAAYRTTVRIASLAAASVLAVWLWRHPRDLGWLYRNPSGSPPRRCSPAVGVIGSPAPRRRRFPGRATVLGRC